MEVRAIDLTREQREKISSYIQMLNKYAKTVEIFLRGLDQFDVKGSAVGGSGLAIYSAAAVHSQILATFTSIRSWGEDKCGICLFGKKL